MEVRIAVAGPMTGPDAAFGEQAVRGAQAAAEHINNSGEWEGMKISLLQADDTGQPDQAVDVARKLVSQEKVNYIVGHMNSSCTIPASEIYSDAKAVNITPSATIGEVTDRKLPTVFRMCGVNDRQGERIADYIAKRHHHNAKIIIVHDKRPYGESLVKHTKEELERRKLSPLFTHGINRGEKDFRELIEKIEKEKCNVVIFNGMATEAGPLIRQIRDKGMKDLMFISGDGIATSKLVSYAGGEQYTEGIYMTFSTDVSRAHQTAIEGLRKVGYEAEGFTINAYAAVQTIAAGVKGVKSSDSEEVAKWLKKNSVDTAMGKVEFHHTGDLRGMEYNVYQWDKHGRWHRVKDQ